jgi:hypothetical protein
MRDQDVGSHLLGVAHGHCLTARDPDLLVVVPFEAVARDHRFSRGYELQVLAGEDGGCAVHLVVAALAVHGLRLGLQADIAVGLDSVDLGRSAKRIGVRRFVPIGRHRAIVGGQRVAIEGRTASCGPRIAARDVDTQVLPPFDAIVRLNVERSPVIRRNQPDPLGEGGREGEPVPLTTLRRAPSPDARISLRSRGASRRPSNDGIDVLYGHQGRLSSWRLSHAISSIGPLRRDAQVIQLFQWLMVVPRDGVEPPTRGFSAFPKARSFNALRLPCPRLARSVELGHPSYAFPCAPAG